MIPREQGSDTSRVEIRGGVHDGATGRIVNVWDSEDEQVVTVALDQGGTLDLSFTRHKRETAQAEVLRTIGS